MIIFELDNVLADDSHRRHFIDHMGDHPDYYRHPCECCRDGSHHKIQPQYHKITQKEWYPNYRTYYDACDKDSIIEATLTIISWAIREEQKIQIWTSRSELVRDKTIKWFSENWFLGLFEHELDALDKAIKMRPIGNTEPAHVLKERWLDEYIAWSKLERNLPNGMLLTRNDMPDFVFDFDPDSIAMWRRRGIFCLDCKQD